MRVMNFWLSSFVHVSWFSMFLYVNIIFFTFSASFYDQLKLERVMSKPLYLDIESSLEFYYLSGR